MLSHEEIDRLEDAAELLFALTSCHCSQRFISAFLQVSDSTLSCWNRSVEDSKRNVTVPSTEQLVKLAALLRHQLSENLNAVTESYESRKHRPVGQHIRFVLREFAKEAMAKSDAIEEAARKHEAHALWLEEVALRGVSDKQLARELADRFTDESEASSEMLRAAHERAAATAASEMEASKVTEADVERARQVLEEWREKYRRTVLDRARNKRRRQKEEKPDGG